MNWNYFICGAFIVLIIGAAFAYVKICRKELLNINAEVERILKAQDVAAALEKSEPLKLAWKAFENSLTRTNDVRYSTVDAAEFFSVQTLTQGLNMTFWQSYGGIFTGLGILGTFFGLTYGLYGVDMTSGDIDTLKTGIAELLSGVNTAFVTSLVGIAGGLVYSGFHHSLLIKLGKNVKSLTDKLDEIYPRRTVEDWLAEKFSEAKRQTRSLQSIDLETQNQIATLQSIDAQAKSQAATLQSIDAQAQDQTTTLQNINKQVAGEVFLLKNSFDESKTQTATLQSIDAQAQEQTTALKNIGEDVARAIYDGLDERMNEAVDKFCDRLEEKILPQVDRICAAIEKLGTSSAEGFDKRLAEIAGKQMARFSDALDRFSDNIDEKLKVANEISKIMNEQLLDTLQKLRDALERGEANASEQRDADNEKFSSMLERLIKLLNNTAAGNAAQINEAVKAFREIVDCHNAATKKTFDQIQNLLSDTESLLEIMNEASLSFKTAADPVKQSTLQLTQNLTATSAQMKTLAEANQITRENLAVLSTRLATFVQNYNGIANELERSITIVTDSLDNYNSVTNAGLKEKLAAFDKSMNDAFSYLQQSVDDLGEIVGYVKQKRGTVIK